MASTISNEGCTALSELEIDLIVDNIGLDLHRLASKLELDRTEMAELEGQDHLKAKAYKMISWWSQRCGKTATKASMIDILTNLRRTDIANKLKKTGENVNENLQADIEKFLLLLQRNYSRLRVPQPPGITKDICIDKIFSDQDMEIVNKSKPIQGRWTRQALIQQFSRDEVLRILVEGDPGFGKTTLTVKLALDWAKKGSYIRSQFDMVLLIPLREVGEESIQDVIAGMINRAIKKTSVTRELLTRYFKDHNVLLLLDGYDEMCVEGQNLLDPILMKHELDKTCILVTSRNGSFTIKETVPHSPRFLLFKDEKVDFDFWDSRVVLKGLSTVQQDEILKKHFEIEYQTLDKMDELFQDKVDELFRSPLLLFWLGWMLENQGVRKIQTKTSFYKTLVNLILNKTLVREQKMKENEVIDIFSVLTSDDVTTLLRKDICKFGRLSIEKLITNKALFNKSDFKFLDESLLLKSDLFLTHSTLTKNQEETYYQPMHRSFMEFLAAYSICYSSSELTTYNEFKQNISMVMDRGLRPSLGSLVFPFVAGLLENNAHWLFQSLTPWAPFHHLGNIELINLFTELNHIDDGLMQILLNLIPSYYEIPSQGIGHSYFESELHKKLLKKAAEKELIQVVKWRVEVNPFPPSEIKLKKLYLFLQKQNVVLKNLDKTVIHCEELICVIDKKIKSSSLEKYLSIAKIIKADKHMLYLKYCYPVTIDLVLDAIDDQWTNINFHRIKLYNCRLMMKHMNKITELVKNNRVTKGISISLNGNHQLTADCVIQLWEAVVQSQLITEFSFTNFYPNFTPIIKLTAPAYKKAFELLRFEYYFKLEHDKSLVNENSIQHLTWMNDNEEYCQIANVFSNFKDVKYFQCYDKLLETCLSSKLCFLRSVSELYLYLKEEPSLNLSLMDQMPSLTTLLVDIKPFSKKFPAHLETFVATVLQGTHGNSSNSRKLKMLGVHSISSDSAFKFLVECLTKVNTIELDCLLLMFTWELKLATEGMLGLKRLLKNKCIKRLSIVDWYGDNFSISKFVPCWFSEEEFEYQYKLLGCDEHPIGEQMVFHHLMDCRGIYHIALKNCLLK